MLKFNGSISETAKTLSRKVLDQSLPSARI